MNEIKTYCERIGFANKKKKKKRIKIKKGILK